MDTVLSLNVLKSAQIANLFIIAIILHIYLISISETATYISEAALFPYLFYKCQ
jgi:hypothetical protein